MTGYLGRATIGIISIHSHITSLLLIINY
ncbi:uncharacterized protein METZ01_LOCUS8313 [marine metagenome]|uniref:Uncharacterized protein n=1 Tax=marine metagenome TaxID=408172 RepID=A0A381NM95_9ZZZZ